MVGVELVRQTIREETPLFKGLAEVEQDAAPTNETGETFNEIWLSEKTDLALNPSRTNLSIGMFETYQQR